VRRERKRERAVWRDLGMKAGIGCIPCTSQPLSHSASILRPDPTTPAWNSLPGFSTTERKNEGKELRHLRNGKGETLRKNLRSSPAAGLYLGRKTWEGPSAIRVALWEGGDHLFLTSWGFLASRGGKGEVGNGGFPSILSCTKCKAW
jgi:hypothetical protein